MSPRLVAAIGMLMLALAGSSPAAAAPTITEYGPEPFANTAPLDITSGAGGQLWLTQSGEPEGVASITLGGSLSSFETTGSHPRAITMGPDGKLWFTEIGCSNVGTVNPETGHVTEYSLGEFKPIGIAAGPEGDLWLAVDAPRAAIVSLNPSTLETTEYPAPTEEGQPFGVTIGREGDVWFTERGEAGAIGRLDPATKVVTEYTSGLTPNEKPTGITTGPEGDIWFTEDANPGRIGRLEPLTGSIVEFSEGLTAGMPEAIATGTDGNLYFTERNGGGALARITPAGVITEFTEGLTANDKPNGITSGPDGNIWFVLSGHPGEVGRLTVAPSVADEAAEDETPQSTTVRALVGANAQPTSYDFEYGSSKFYGSSSPAESAGSADTPVEVSAKLGGLTPGATYHYRVLAVNASGSTVGPDSTFVAAAAPPAPEPPPAIAGPQPAVGPPLVRPSIGRSAGVAPVSGSIYVKSPGSHAFTSLSGTGLVPVGSVIDAAHGMVRLATSLGHGVTQTALVWGGSFEVVQSARKGGLTELVLRGALPDCSPGGRASASRARARAPRSRSLWAQDDHGHFSTHGANSVATVLGTEWDTVDSCQGTLTQVLRGRVRVRSLDGGAAVIVSAGHGFLARP